MSFKDHNFKGVYIKASHDTLSEFYIPALSESVKYKRLIGFFNAGALSLAAQGLQGFVVNQGEMHLIIGEPLDDDEFLALKEGSDLLEMKKIDFEKQLLAILCEPPDKMHSLRFDILRFLVASRRLKIQLAFKRNQMGMVHDKVGLLEDSEGNKIIFTGSDNDTRAAWDPDFNWESTSVYKGWKEEHKEHFLPYEHYLESMLSSESLEDVIIADIPGSTYSKIINSLPLKTISEMEKTEKEEVNRLIEFHKRPWPKIPLEFKLKPYKLEGHQEKARIAWLDTISDYGSPRGILSHCTGSGKTVTAIHSIAELADKNFNNQGGFFLVISVPYVPLAEQWVEELSYFSINPIECWGRGTSWHKNLERKVSNFLLNPEETFIAVVVVNNTLRSSDQFKEQIKRIEEDSDARSRFIFIGDEIHDHGTKLINESLPDASFRLGLSATPFSGHISKEDSDQRIKDYYGGVVHSYSLEHALRDKVLTQYNYYVHRVYLTTEEDEEYSELSKAIASCMDSEGRVRPEKQESFNILAGARARVLGSANEKFTVLEGLLKDHSIDKDREYSLFFCGDGSTENIDKFDADQKVRDINRVSFLLENKGWTYRHFTHEQKHRQRREILLGFRQELIQALVAIRVLDVGIDIPSCKTAFLLASSRSPRQYIQRRGRILRKSENKEISSIHDFLVLSRDATFGADLFEKEASRICEFSRFAKNEKNVINSTKDIFQQYGIDYEDVVESLVEESERIIDGK